jgi:hypothetical protein
MILRAGNNVAARSTEVRGLHPRTAVGTDAAGETLYVVVVDGRQEGYSEGMSLPELGDLILEFGAYDALNFDGGGSSTLVVRRGGALDVLNSPIDRGRPGKQRPIANHMAICSRGRGHASQRDGDAATEATEIREDL